MGKKKEESNVFQDLVDIAVCIYMLLMVVALPLYFKNGFYYIGTNKATFFREASIKMWTLLLPMLVMFGGIMIAVKKMSPQKKEMGKRIRQLPVTYGFAGLFLGSLLLSYGCSDYKEAALWGAEGWYMGLLPQLFFVGLYVLAAFCWKGHLWMIMVMELVSFGIFVLAYLNRFTIYPIDMKVAQEMFLSTIGNINWFCGYLVSVFFIGFYQLWYRQKWPVWQQVWLCVYVYVGFAVLVIQGSMSGIAALGVVLLVTFCMATGDGQQMENFWLELVLLSVACLTTRLVRLFFPASFNLADGVVDRLTDSDLALYMTVISLLLLLGFRYLNRRRLYPVKQMKIAGYVMAGAAILGVAVVCILIGKNTRNPGSIGALSEIAFFTFSDHWGSNRGATWAMSWQCFQEQNVLHKCLGVGPDSMSFYIYQDGSEALLAWVNEVFPNQRLTNAHNEWLTILVNLGIVGLIGYVGMMLSSIIRFLKAGKKSVVVGACGMCLLAFTVNNLFSFQQTLNMATIFVVWGIGECFYRKR